MSNPEGFYSQDVLVAVCHSSNSREQVTLQGDQVLYSFPEGNSVLLSVESDEIMDSLEAGQIIERAHSMKRGDKVKLRKNQDQSSDYSIQFGKKIGKHYDGIYICRRDGSFEVLEQHKLEERKTWGTIRNAFVAAQTNGCSGVLILGCKSERPGTADFHKDGVGVHGTGGSCSFQRMLLAFGNKGNKAAAHNFASL